MKTSKAPIKIRFNTEKDKTDLSLPAWRVLHDGVEYLAEKVTIKTDAWTSMDEIAPGKVKWHISCLGFVEWNTSRTECTIHSSQPRPEAADYSNLV